jgi:putative DNA primase/helicase
VFHDYQNGKQHADALKEAYQANHGAAGREWVRYLAIHQQRAKQAVRDAQERWRALIPADYGEQVHRVGERFAILESALVMGADITGWTELQSRDAIQHCFNAWVKEFGTGNKEHQQIIEQCEAFLNAYGFSRYLSYPDSDSRDLPIKELAGYRMGSQAGDETFKFYTFPAAFEQEIARGFNHTQFARALASAGMLETGDKGRHKKKALRKMGGKQHVFYVLTYSPDEE